MKLKLTRPRNTKCKRALLIPLLAALLLSVATVAPAVRVVTYNVLNFPGSTGASRESYFRTALAGVAPDVLVVQEMLSQDGVDQFLDEILNYSTPGEFAACPFTNGYDTDNALFYRVSSVELVSTQQIGTALRDISEYVLRPVGYVSTDAEFRIYSVHLKAGSTSTDQTKRLAEATILRNWTNGLPDGTSFMVVGDFNIRSSTEAAYQKLVGSEADDSGRSFDPIDTPGTWHDNYAFASVHTQSPRTLSFGGGATGGMDDRFDLILTSASLMDGEVLDWETGTYTAYGNDGLHFNTAINSGTNYAVGNTVADALHEASDHLPVYLNLSVPALVSVPSALDLGTVIVGATHTEELTLSNTAQAPADELDYEFSVTTGFDAPGAAFELDAGASAVHDIAMDTSSAGLKSGVLTVHSDDVDRPTVEVSLSGRVIEHARPSLDDEAVKLADTLDFGSHAAGEFTTQTFGVSNVAYTSLQALLDVYSAEIVGGDGRFGFVGGFTESCIGSSTVSYTVEFDDQGATADSLYEAVLTLDTRDDVGVSGATDLDDLVLHLFAFVQSGTSITEGESFANSVSLRSANPSNGPVELRLRTRSASEVSVRIYDISGRVVKTLLSDRLPDGEHDVSWDGRDSSGSVCPSGVYLVRATVGSWVGSSKLVILR